MKADIRTHLGLTSLKCILFYRTVFPLLFVISEHNCSPQGAHSLEGREQANTERQCSESLLDRRAYDTKDTHKTSFPFSSWLHHMACRILVPQPGIKPESSAVRLWSPRHWTIREFPKYPLCRAWRAKVWWCPFLF